MERYCRRDGEGGVRWQVEHDGGNFSRSDVNVSSLGHSNGG